MLFRKHSSMGTAQIVVGLLFFVLLIYGFYTYHEILGKLRLSEDTLDKNEKNYVKLSRDYTTLILDKQKLEETIHSKIKEETRLKGEIIELSDKLSSEKSKYRAEISALRNEKESLQEQLHSFGNEKKDLSGEVQGLKAEVGQVKEESEQMVKRHKQEMENEVAPLRDSIANCERKLKEVQKYKELYEQQNIKTGDGDKKVSVKEVPRHKDDDSDPNLMQIVKPGQNKNGYYNNSGIENEMGQEGGNKLGQDQKLLAKDVRKSNDIGQVVAPNLKKQENVVERRSVNDQSQGINENTQDPEGGNYNDIPVGEKKKPKKSASRDRYDRKVPPPPAASSSSTVKYPNNNNDDNNNHGDDNFDIRLPSVAVDDDGGKIKNRIRAPKLENNNYPPLGGGSSDVGGDGGGDVVGRGGGDRKIIRTGGRIKLSEDENGLPDAGFRGREGKAVDEQVQPPPRDNLESRNKNGVMQMEAPDHQQQNVVSQKNLLDSLKKDENNENSRNKMFGGNLGANHSEIPAPEGAGEAPLGQPEVDKNYEKLD